ncbi:MAG: hypothetical protein IJS39_04280 [Synergistaceae bacterium]|nr:hypothetical protein [Synergistaceae bacterium]
MNNLEQDTQILSKEELHKIPECVNAMANSYGGVIKPEGKEDIRVEALKWYEKPIALNGRVWRRIEGQNVICGAWAKSVMASRDSCDDFPAEGAALDSELLESFRRAVLGRNEEYSALTHDEFLRRTGIFSGRHLTSAGALMFGEGLMIRAVLRHGKLHAEIHESNIWGAYTRILPRITRALSAKSSGEVRNALTNALIHSDYSIDTQIDISILSEPARIVITSPGIITGSVRNHRLHKLFTLAGISAGTFTAEYDMLNFRTVSTIHIEAAAPILL